MQSVVPNLTNEHSSAVSAGPVDSRRDATAERMASGLSATVRRRRGKRFPANLADLKIVAATATVAVTKCPPGIHSGWRPKWF